MDSKAESAAAGWRAVLPASAARDIVGGFNAAMISLPQSLGLGIVAFAPLGAAFVTEGALSGLLGAACAGLLIPLLGGNRVMISGPRVAATLVVATVTAQLAAPGSPFEGQVAFAATLAMLALAGVIQLLFGLFRLGAFIKYVPYPVVAGIVTGSGVLIISSQLRWLAGIPDGSDAPGVLSGGAKPMAGALIVAGVTAAVTLIVPRLWPRLPGLFLGLLAGVSLHHALVPLIGEAGLGGTVGVIQETLGSLLVSTMESWATFGRSVFGLEGAGFHPVIATLVLGALSVAVLASQDTLLAALTVDGMTLERTDFNRELVAHGIANTLASAIGGLFSAGRLASTIVSYKAGARSRLASVTNALVLLSLALGASGALAYLPNSVVAGILLVVGIELVDKWTLARIRELAVSGWRGDPSILTEVGIVIVVTAVAVTAGLMAALAFGLLIAIVVMMARLRRSLIRRMYRGAHVHSRRQRDQRSMETLAEKGDQIAILDLEGPIFFNSADHLESVVERLTGEGVRYVILDMKRVTEIDATGARTIEHLVRRAARAGAFVAFSYLFRERRHRQLDYLGSERRRLGRARRVWVVLDRLGVFRTVGGGSVFPDTDAALGVCEDRLLGGTGRGGKRDTSERQALAGVFQGFTGADIRLLRRRAERRTWRTGEIIFAEGGEGDAIYLLTCGRADVLIRVQGWEWVKRVDTLTPGSVFGEMAVLDEKPRAASIVVATNAAGYRLTAEAFRTMKRDNPQLALKLLSNLCLIMSARVRAANRMITELED